MLRWAFLLFLSLFYSFGQSQTNTSLEYFIDTDPGFGFGTNLPIPNNDSVDISFNINIQNHSQGLHTLFVRVKNANGVWSFTQRHVFLVLGNLNTDIAKIEYYFDSDPGFDSGTSVPFTVGDTVDVSFSPNFTGLSQGVHTIYVRAKDNNGLWTFTTSKAILVYNNELFPEIIKLEYCFDIDPGYENGTTIVITPNDTIDVVAPISLSGLTVGSHKLYVRGKDNNGNWSHIHRKDVNVTATDNLYPAIAVTPALKTLTAVNCVTSVIDSFTVTNTGSNPLNVNISETASWMSVSPNAMGIPVGQSRTLYVTGTPTPALPAQSSANITFTTNDPVNPTVTRSVVFNVPSTAYSMEVSSDSLLLDTEQVNNTASGQIILTNTSCSSLEIDTIIHSTPRFSHIINQGGFPSGGTKDVTIHFESADIGTFQDTMIIITQAGSDTIYLSATALGVPVIDLQNDSLQMNFSGCAVDTTLTTRIYNNGDGPLNLQIIENTTTNILSHLALQSGISVGNQSNTTPLGTYFNTNAPLTIDKLGVFDSGMDGITSNIQVGIINRTTNNNVAGPITITGTAGQLTGAYRMVNISPILLPPGNYAIVAVGFNSSNPNGNAGVNGNPSTLNTINGVISYLGEYVGIGTSFTLPTSQDGGPLGRYHAGTFSVQEIQTNTIQYPSWMTFAFDDNTVSQNDSTTLNINLTNVTLPVGAYNYNILVSINDTITPIDTIRLHLNIPGDSSLTMQYLTVSFDTIPRNTSTTFTSNLINNGCTPVYVSAASFGTTVFEENVSTIYLPPYSSYPMLLKFQPPLSGDFQDTLMIVSNVGVQQFSVVGRAAGALTYELSKLASNVNIQDCNGMTMDTIRLYNMGDGQGNWSLANISQIPSWLMVNPQSGTLMAGDSVAIAIGYDATGLINNTYNQTLRINLSDPETPYIDIPLGMYVVGGSLMSFSQDTVDFGLTYFTTMEKDTIILYNAGCDTFIVTNVLRDPQFGIDQTGFTVLPDSSKQIIVSFTPGAIGMYADTVRFIGTNDTLYLPIYGQGVSYPQLTKAVKDSIVITMPSPINGSTLNTNNWAIWGEQTGKRTGTYSVSGNEILFIPTQNFFAGEEVSYTITQHVKYASGENIQPFSDSKNVKVWHPTMGEFVIRPTNIQIVGVNRFAIGDIESDGDLDFILQNYIGNQSTKYHIITNNLNNFSKTGEFTDSYYAFNSNFLALRDLNSDGLLDIVANSNGNNLSGSKIISYKNIGSNTFTTGIRSDLERNINSLDLIDFNFDGIFDIGGTLSNDWGFFDYIKFRQGSSNLLFVNETSNILYNSTTYLNGLSGRFIDIDQDGDQDFISFHNNSLFYLTKYNNGFKPALSTSVIGNNILSTKYDFNGDSKKDMLCENNKVFIQTNLGFQSNSVIQCCNYQSYTIPGDINGDNLIDLFIVNYNEGLGFNNSHKTALYNSSTNQFDVNSKGFNFQNIVFDKLTDLDNDGDLDFACLDAQGRLWIAYNEDNNAEMYLSQYAIVDTFACADSIIVPIKIRNIGTSPLVWQQDAATASPYGVGGLGATSAAVAGASWLFSSSQYSEIPAGDSLTLNLKINSTGLTTGSYTFNYIINSNDSENYKDTVAISFVLLTDSTITFNPSSWNFGLVDTAQVYTKNIVVTNTSCQQITLSGTFAQGSIYTATNLLSANIPAFGSRTITITLNPNALTTYIDTLELTHSYGMKAIPLSATGCYISPVNHIHEQVCTTDSVGLDSILYQNVSGCDSLVVWHYFVPGINPQGLKLAMSFNGNANDLSGNNFNGAVSGATLTTDRFGQPNKAYSFDGNDQIITQQNNTISGNNPRTMMAWVNINEIVPNNHYPVIRGGANGSANDFTLIIQFNTSNQLRLILRNYTSDLYTPYVNYSVGTWAHVGVSYSGSPSHSIKLFLNGSLLASSNVSLNTSFTNYVVGNYVDQTGGSSPFKGKIDDVLVYPYTLSQMDINQIFNLNLSIYDTSPVYVYSQSCEPLNTGLDTTILVGDNQYGCDSTIITQTSFQLPISNEGLVAYYPFSGNAQDGSGLGNHGTVNGATLTSDRYGNANKAYSFGGNDEIVISNRPSLLNFDGKISISLWVRPTQYDNGYTAYLSKTNLSNISGYFDLVTTGANETILNFDGKFYKVLYTPPLNKWTNLTCVVENNIFKLYVDGFYRGQSGVIGSETFDPNQPLIIGSNARGVKETLRGQIDEIFIFKRALSPSEIQSLYLSQSYINTCIPGDVGIDTLSLTNICGADSLVHQITSLQTPASPDKLVAYYPFTGNANDMSGWGNHGTVNGATLTTDRFGNPNGAYSFDGVNSYVQISNPPRNYDKEITVSWWVNANSFQIGAGIGQSQANVPSSGTWLMHGNVDRSIIWYVNDNGTWRQTPNSPILSSGWHHIVGTAKADSLRLYVNGTLVAKTTGISNRIFFDQSSVIQIGKDVRYASGRWLNGSIDDVQIFERALTPSEIQALYTNSNTNYTFNYFQSCDTSAIGIDTTIYAGAAQNGCDSLAINHTWLTQPVSNEGLQAYYTFDGNADDMSGYDRHGLLTGATLTTDQYGNANTAYSFDGVDDRIDSLDIPLNGNSDWTIATWLKTNTINSSYTDFQSVLSNHDESFKVGFYTADKKWTIHDNGDKISISNSISSNETAFVIFQKSGNTLQIYKNDTLLIQNTNGSNLTISSVKRIGITHPTGATPFDQEAFNGTIFDFWVYQRALSAAEMQQLYLLNKSANSAIAAKDSSLTFEPTMTGLTSSITTHVSNTTCDTILIDSIYTTNTVFSTNLNIPYLLPYQSKKFTVTFSPYAAVPFAGQLIIRSNGVDTVTIALSGNGCALCACPTQDVVINTQTQLNDFVAQYGGCDTIPVNMSIIGDASLTNMAGLQFIERIEGNLHILNSQGITSMNGWQNLAGLAGELRIENNSQLVTLDSLIDLVAIGGQLSIKNNTALTSLNGLQNLLSVGGNLSITNNAALANCSAICDLINASSPFGIAGQRTITGNPSECSSLNEVTIRCAPFCLTGNIVLTSQAEVNAFVAKGNMLSCNTLVGNLTISSANINSLAGMTFLKTITGNLTIQNNSILPTINGLDSLRKVGNTLTIVGNGTLTHINGLLRLDTIGLDLTIQNNAALTQVGGLAQVDRVGRNLNVSSNNSLGDCAGLCYLIKTPASVGGSRTVTNNPSPCSSITEVKIKCNENDCPNQDYILTTQAEVNTFIASFYDCDSIIGNLNIEGGNSINNISGLSFITYIGGSLTIHNNNLLTTLSGFNNLQKVNWALRIENNAALTNMTQLKRLKHIGNELRLVNNDAMIVLTGMDSIQHIGTNLTLTQNNVLVDASQLCRLIYEDVVDSSYTISNNPSPVSSVNEVTAICIYGSLVTKVLIQNLQDFIEEGSLLTFNVALDYPPNDTVTVSLVSSNQTEVPLPATVKILPGTISRQVSVLLPNNNVPEKDKSITITAGAPYLTSATGQLVLADHDDVPSIELIITQSEVSEGAGLYATSAKVRRLGALGNILNVILQSSNPGQVSLPTGVNILANETEKTFFIGVLDNALADGNRMNTITATVIINSCVCPAPAGTNGVSSRSFTLLDNDGPALTLAINPLSMPEGKINAGTLTITRNTPTNVALTVSLISSDTTEIVLPATAIIPINATSVNIPVWTKSDGQEDGNQEVNITASHPGFTNGVIWAIVTDINKPDLVIPSAEALEDTIALEEILPFKVYIHNKGITASTRGVSLIGYLSSDASISSDDHVIGQYFLDISITAGDTIVYGGIGSIPQRIGNFNLLFKINPNESITELLYLNNTSPAVPVTIIPNYTGTAIVDSTVFLIGAPIVIYGSSYNSQGAKIGNVNLDIYLIRDGIRRTIAIKTNAQGDYSYTFNPLQSDFGHFIVGACYPGFNITEQQDAFDILGLTINNGNFLTWDMLLGDTISSGIALRNVTNIPMSNVTMTPLSLPNGCSLVFNTIANFPANTTLSMGYQIVAGAVTAPGVYQQFPIAVISNTTTLQQVTGYYHCKAAQGLLVASVTNIVQNINKDQSKIVEFTITNRGQGSTGAITVAVPNANWVRLVSPASIAALAPNQSATITVEFIPTSALPLNTPATGNVAINASSANGVSVPFTITKVSDITGSILIDVINQFTYFTPEAPHLEGARVRISNYFTGQVYADGLTNSAGIFNAGNLPEGQLRIVVDAERHKSHDGVIDIAPGSNGTKVIFLEYRAISFSWDVQPTNIEDEYEIDLIMNFEANVPVPVIMMSMPETLPRLSGSETFSFYINMTNKGLITAKEVKLDLPIDPEYELLTTYQPQDILAQQTIQVPVLMKRRVESGNINGGNGSQNRIKVNDDVIKKAEQRLNFKKN